jgi:hypothetical protein
MQGSCLGSPGWAVGGKEAGDVDNQRANLVQLVLLDSAPTSWQPFLAEL